MNHKMNCTQLKLFILGDFWRIRKFDDQSSLRVNQHKHRLQTAFLPLISVLFYPVIPVLAYVNLLWAKPKRGAGETASSSAKFREAEYFACIAHAISGGIGTPVQLIFQVQIQAF